MAWVTVAAINFRNTSTYVTDDPGQVYCLPGDLYPTTRTKTGGTPGVDDVTFGWSSSTFGANIATSGDKRVAGNCRSSSAGVNCRVDLPATGKYRVKTGGRNGSALATGHIIMDNSTTVLTSNGSLTDSTDIIDSNNTVHADPAAWAADAAYSADLTFASTILKVQKSPTNGLYISHLEVQRWVDDALIDITTKDEFGADVTTPTFYAGQPSGYQALRLGLPSGSSFSTSSFVLGGDLASYFTVQEINSVVWLVTNSTRLPDSLAGSGKTLTIQQTDSGFVDPHTTTLTCNVTSSQGRDTTGWLGKITTQNWLNRKAVLAVTDAAWAGYQGEDLSTDVTVTSTAELDAAMAAIADGRTVWDRILLENGAGPYTGSISEALAYDTGGGLLIEPAPGHDPEINIDFADMRIHGLHWRNTLMPGVGVGLQQFRFYDPGSGGINSTGRFNKVLFTGNRVGRLFSPGQTFADVITAASSALTATSFVTADHGQDITVKNNQFYGVPGAVFVSSGVRASVFEDNDCRCVLGDIYRPSNAATWTSTQGVFADNHVYCLMRGNTIRDEMDTAGWANLVHPDTWQTGAFAGNISNWSTNATISVGDKRLNMLAPTPAIYECTTAGTTAASGTGPLRSSQGQTGITDGTVTWKHIADYTTASNLYGVMENNTMNSNSETAAEGTARQSFIDSNGGKNCPGYISINNNAIGTESQYGMRPAGGALYAEYNTLAQASIVSGVQTMQQGQIWSDSANQIIMALHNVVQSATSNSGSGAKLLAYDEVVLNWASGAVSPNRPGDKLTGPFSQLSGAGNRWGFPTLVFNGTAAAFEADMRAMLTTLDGVAGIQADDTPTPSGNAYRGGLSLSLRLAL